MLALGVFLFAATIQISLCRGPPQLPPNVPKECLRPPRIENPRECCKLPAIFSKEDFESCGFKEENVEKSRYGPPDCTKQLCLLKTHELAKDDKVDREALFKFFDDWTETYPDFKQSVQSAKDKCLGEILPGPPEICEANRVVFCISSVLYMECPKWADDIEDCKTLKDHINTCAKYFPQ